MNGKSKKGRALIGFDGFVDEIIQVVDQRENFSKFSRVKTISAFSERIASAARESANIELVVSKVKIGGNGPIMANAMANLQVKVSYIGSLGFPEINPVFLPLQKKCKIYTLCEPAHTDALEFEDGKIMLGKMSSLNEVTWQNLLDKVGLEKLRKLFSDADLIALVNWTMLPHMSDIWEHILKEICPSVDKSKERYVFFDLADPEKRTFSDKKNLISLIPKFSKYFKVILGLNEREARQIAEVIEISKNWNTKTSNKPQITKAEDLCHFIFDSLRIYCVVVHPIKYAVASEGGKLYYQDGPTTKTPVITTGGGDHFNAGFCTGMILNLGVQHSLLMGVCCSGYYVMTGKSPSLETLNKAIEMWEKNKKLDLKKLND